MRRKRPALDAEPAHEVGAQVTDDDHIAHTRHCGTHKHTHTHRERERERERER
jgi:hypothetical protein